MKSKPTLGSGKRAEVPEDITLKLNDLNARKNQLLGWMQGMTYQRNAHLLRLIWIPVLVLVAVFVLMLINSSRYFVMRFLFDILAMPSSPVSTYWFYIFIYVLAILLATIPVLRKQFSLNLNQKELSEIEDEIEQISLSLPAIRLGYLRKRFFIVAGEAIKTSWIDDNRRVKSERLQDDISNILSVLERREKYKTSPDTPQPPYDWDDAQIRLSQWNDLLKDEKTEHMEARNWKTMSILIAIVYLVLILISIPSFDVKGNVFGVPFPIIIWSALGSFAAILYRFYKLPLRIKFEKEFRWLIARPIIGIVMGAISYLALVSGALVFNANPAVPAATDLQKTGQLWQYWMVAFLAGFSDKFYEKVIEWLTSKFTAGAEDNAESDEEKGDGKKVSNKTTDSNETEGRAESEKT